MSQTFLEGGLAEKARLANTLICELLSALPGDIFLRQRLPLHAVTSALQEIQNDLRIRDSEKNSDNSK